MVAFANDFWTTLYQQLTSLEMQIILCLTFNKILFKDFD